LNINKEINTSDKINLKILDNNVNTIQLDLTDKNASLELEKNNYKLNTDISINKIISEISEDN
jgi:predicted acetyltransferase